jgi:hypothetical protein
MLAIAVAALAFAGWAMILRPPRPRAVVTAVHDFGTKPQWTYVRHTWTVANEGTAPLRLRYAGSPCNAAPLDLRHGEFLTVPPGASSPVVGMLNTRSWRGKHRWSIQLATDDPDLPMIDLAFQGVVIPPAAPGAGLPPN